MATKVADETEQNWR